MEYRVNYLIGNFFILRCIQNFIKNIEFFINTLLKNKM